MIRRHRQAGFTLVEGLISVVILSIIMLALAGTFLVGSRTIGGNGSQLAADSTVSSATQPLIRDFTSSTVTSTLPVTLNPGSGTLSLQYGSPATTATYTIDSGGNLIRTLGGASSGYSVSARGLTQLVVSVGSPGCQLNVTLQPSATGAAPKTFRVSRRIGGSGCF